MAAPRDSSCSSQKLPAAVDNLVNRLVAGLAAHVKPRAGLWDPLLKAPTPPDHYGLTSAALALRLGQADASGEWRVPLTAWISLRPDQRGHMPFNRFMLLLLRQHFSVQPTVHSDDQLLDDALRLCPLRKHYPSNNWALLAQLCILIESSAGQKPRCVRSLSRMIDRWTAESGAFIDFPRSPGKQFSTPITYHLKALFTLCAAAIFANHEGLTPRIQRLSHWANMFWDNQGFCGGFGRSTHALFGDACLLAVLLLAGRWSASEMLAQRLEGQFRDDGLLWLNPSGPASGDTGCDSYMFLSVYNAWAAALLTWARQVRRKNEVPVTLEALQWQLHRPRLVLDRSAGFISINTDQFKILMATSGQPPQAFDSTTVELRYAGAVPFHCTVSNQQACVPPIQSLVSALRHQPMLAGWTPIFLADDHLFGLTNFYSVEVSEANGKIVVRLRGQPSALTRFDPATVLQRVIAAIDWRLLDGALGRRQALHRRRLPVECQIIWKLEPNERKVQLKSSIRHRGGGHVQYLNPAGHAVVPSSIRLQAVFLDDKLDRTPDLKSAPIAAAVSNGVGFSLPSLRLPNATISSSIFLSF